MLREFPPAPETAPVPPQPERMPPDRRQPPESRSDARAEERQRLADHVNAMAERVQHERDENLIVGAANEALLGIIEVLRLDPDVDAVLGIREAKLQLEHDGKPVRMDEVIVERMAASLPIRGDGLRRGLVTPTQFRAGLEQQVRKIIDEYRKTDARRPSAPAA